MVRLMTFGALAQLGEHLLCKQRVIGSIPIGSTKLHSTEQVHSIIKRMFYAFDRPVKDAVIFGSH
jgi:hypothetical protein